MIFRMTSAIHCQMLSARKNSVQNIDQAIPLNYRICATLFQMHKEGEKGEKNQMSYLVLVWQEISSLQVTARGRERFSGTLDNFVPIVHRYMHVTRPPSRRDQPMGARCACRYHVVLRQRCCWGYCWIQSIWNQDF